MDSKLKVPSGVPVVAVASVATVFAALSLWRMHAFAAVVVPAVVALDYRIILFVNHFARRSWALDTLFYEIDSNPLATAPLLMAMWWAWFKDRGGEAEIHNREVLLHGLVGSFLYILLFRIPPLMLPYRARPLHNPELHFLMPYNVDPQRLLGWSSFPSDHAILWFFLAATVYLVSRRLGIFLYLYVSLTLCVARIYIGIHYPSDIIVGALLGVGVAQLAKVSVIRKTFAEQPMKVLQRAPGVFYAGFFIISSQMAEGFNSLHEIQSFVHATVKSLMRWV